MKKDKYKILIFSIISLAVGFAIGYTMGFSAAISAFAKEAAKFVNLNEALVRDYLMRAGLV